jgi:hypothetical protein
VQRTVSATSQTPVVWLNLACLDAPLVSVTWLWLFAKTFHATVAPAGYAALFLTAWLIYLGDRLADTYSLQPGEPCSLRQAFCRNHRRLWVGALAGIAGTDAYLVWRGIAGETLLAGTVIGALALLYLILNHSLGEAWRHVPLKESAIGFLFAAGTLVLLFPTSPANAGPLVWSAIAFALLGTFNCISIAYWERELDNAQRKVSFATRYPNLDRHLGKLLSALALSAGATAVVYRDAAPIFACVSVSSLLLAWLNSNRGRIGRDQRTALADLVLLTPLFALLVMHA